MFVTSFLSISCLSGRGGLEVERRSSFNTWTYSLSRRIESRLGRDSTQFMPKIDVYVMVTFVHMTGNSLPNQQEADPTIHYITSVIVP